MQNICENIKRVRKESGKTQQEMADILNVKRTTYAGWESSTIPDIVSLIEIGKVLNVDWTSLVKETLTGAPAIKPGAPGHSAIEQIKEDTAATREMVKEILSKLSKK